MQPRELVCLPQSYSQEPKHGNNPSVRQWTNGWAKHGLHIQCKKEVIKPNTLQHRWPWGMLSSGQEASRSPKRQMVQGCAYMRYLQQSDSPSWKEERWSPPTGGRVGHYRVPLWEDSVWRGTVGEVTRCKVFNTIHLYISRCFKVNLLYFTTIKNFLKNCWRN